MSRDFRLYLDNILESCRKIGTLTQDMSFEEFEPDTEPQDAVIRNFEVIGDAAKLLPDEIKSQCKGLSGRKS